MLKNDKRGRLKVGFITVVVLTIVVLIVIMQVLADTAPEMDAAAGNVSASTFANNTCVDSSLNNCAGNTLPLTNFFKKKGVIFLALMAGVAIVVIVGVLKFGKSS